MRDGRGEIDDRLVNRDQRHRDHNPRWLSSSLLLHMGYYETTIRPLLSSRDATNGCLPRSAPPRPPLLTHPRTRASIVEKRPWIRGIKPLLGGAVSFESLGAVSLRRRRGRRPRRAVRTARTRSSTSPCSRPWARRLRAAARRVPREPPASERRRPGPGGGGLKDEGRHRPVIRLRSLRRPARAAAGSGRGGLSAPRCALAADGGRGRHHGLRLALRLRLLLLNIACIISAPPGPIDASIARCPACCAAASGAGAPATRCPPRPSPPSAGVPRRRRRRREPSRTLRVTVATPRARRRARRRRRPSSRADIPGRSNLRHGAERVRTGRHSPLRRRRREVRSSRVAQRAPRALNLPRVRRRVRSRRVRSRRRSAPLLPRLDLPSLEPGRSGTRHRRGKVRRRGGGGGHRRGGIERGADSGHRRSHRASADVGHEPLGA